MSVTRRGNSFQATVHYKGERYRKSFPTPAEALVWEKETLIALTNGTPLPTVGADTGTTGNEYQTMTLGGLYELTLARVWKGTSGEKTASLNAKKCLDVLGWHLPPSAVNEMKIDKMIFAFEMEGVSNATINRRLSALSKMLTVGHERGFVPRLLKIQRKEEAAFRNRVITPKEEEELLSMMTVLGFHDMVDFCIIALDTGARASEILKLTVRDVMDNTVVLPGPITKTRRPRIVPLTERARAVLERRGKAVGTGRFFKGFTYDMARHYWDVVRYKMGLKDDPHFVIHGMRHTFCTRLIASGVDMSDVSCLAGHTNLETTRRYLAKAPEHLRSAIDKLQQSMQGKGLFHPLKNTTVDSNLLSSHTPQAVA